MQGNINNGGYVGKQIYIEYPYDIEGYYIRVKNKYKAIQQAEEKSQWLFLIIFGSLIFIDFIEAKTTYNIIPVLVEIVLMFILFSAHLIFLKHIEIERKLLKRELRENIHRLALVFPLDKRILELEEIYKRLPE